MSFRFDRSSDIEFGHLKDFFVCFEGVSWSFPVIVFHYQIFLANTLFFFSQSITVVKFVQNKTLKYMACYLGGNSLVLLFFFLALIFLLALLLLCGFFMIKISISFMPNAILFGELCSVKKDHQLFISNFCESTDII